MFNSVDLLIQKKCHRGVNGLLSAKYVEFFIDFLKYMNFTTISFLTGGLCLKKIITPSAIMGLEHTQGFSF